MNDKDKSKQQLLQELQELRQRNAHLEAVVQKQKQVEKQLIQRAGVREALYEISLEINNQLDLTTLFHVIVDRASSLLGTEGGGLFLVNPDQETVTLTVDRNQRLRPVGRTLRIGEGVAGRVVQSGQPMQIRDYRSWEGRVSSAAPHIGRFLSVPMKRGGRVIGVLDVYDEQAGVFSDEEVHLLSMFAFQAAVALDNAQLLHQTQTALAHTEALYQVVTSFITFENLEDTLQAVADGVAKALPADRVLIYILDLENRQVLKFVQSLRASAYRSRPFEELWQGLTGWVLRHHKPVLSPKGAPDPREALEVQQTRRREKAGSIIVTPLSYRGKSLGTMTAINFIEHDDFTEDDLKLTTAIANQATVTIKNSQLFAEVEQRAMELSTLLDISKAISSTLELERLLELVSQQTAKITGVAGCTLSKWNKEADTVTTWVRWSTLELPDDGKTTYPLTEYPSTRQVLETGEPLIIYGHNSQADPAELAFMRQNGLSRYLLLPLIVGQEIIGLVELYDNKPHQEFSSSQIRLCQALIDQAAVAIENASLHQKTRQQAHQTQEILDAVPDGIFLLDQYHRIKRANLAGQTYLDQIAKKEIGDKLSTLGSYSIEELLSSAEDHRIELNLSTVPQRIFEVMARPIILENVLEGWVVLIRDVTKERMTQQKIQQQDRLVAVGQLAAGIAHDFNNILTSVIGYSELAIINPDIPDVTRQDLERVVQQSQRGAQLVRQVLDFSRQSITAKRPIDLVHFLEELVKLFERTIPENIRVSLTIEPAQDSYIVDGDPIQLQQAITNLTLNSKDAMKFGGQIIFSLAMVSITPTQAQASPDLPEGDWIILSISDTGNGIAVEHIPRLFEPFFTTKEVGQGTGLGLAQVYGIIKQHDGYIEVDSRIDEGTTFTIYLPVSATKFRVLRHDGRKKLAKGRGQVILLVEDDPTVLNANQSMLEHLGYHVVAAVNGQEALKIYDQRQADIVLVLTDVTMPGIDGITLAKILSSKSDMIRVVLLTGYPLNVDEQSLSAHGITACLQKPLTLKQLAQTMSRVIS